VKAKVLGFAGFFLVCFLTKIRPFLKNQENPKFSNLPSRYRIKCESRESRLGKKFGVDANSLFSHAAEGMADHYGWTFGLIVGVRWDTEEIAGNRNAFTVKLNGVRHMVESVRRFGFLFDSVLQLFSSGEAICSRSVQ
jgi:hypothetical protein